MKQKFLRGILGAALSLAFMMPAIVVAQDNDEQEKDLVSQMTDLRGELEDSIADLRDEMSAAEDEAAEQEIIARRRTIEKECATKILALAEENDDQRLELSYLTWLIRKTKGESRDLAFETILTRHIESEKLEKLAGQIGRLPMPEPQIDGFLRELIEKSPHDEVKGKANLALVDMIAKLGSLSDSQIDRYSSTLGESFVEYHAKWSDEAGNDEVDRLLTECVEAYGDSEAGQLAQQKLTQMNLEVGRVAPDIVGEDLEDVAFKLSEYRGKVIMLDFWGDW